MNLVTEWCAKEVKPMPSIYSEELNKLRNNEWDDTSREVVERLPTFKSAKSSLYRSRRKQTPPLSFSREEGIHNWCHDVVDGNVYAVYLVEQVWTGVKSTITGSGSQ
jgi:hypothetical protein